MTRFIHLLSGGAAQGLVTALKPAIEQATDTQLSCTFNAVGMMKQKLLEGAPCDVVILTAALIEQLSTSGHVLAGSARNLGVVKTGVAVKHGTPWPQIETAEQLKAALLAANGIYFADPQLATAGIHFMKVCSSLCEISFMLSDMGWSARGRKEVSSVLVMNVPVKMSNREG